MDAQPGRVRTAAAVTLVISMAMVAVAAVLLGLVTPRLAVGPEHHATPWWVLLPCFAVAEVVVLHLRVRRSALTISFGHIPVVIGLTLLPPHLFFLAAMLGCLATLVGYRRQRGLKLLFNAALWALSMSVGTTLYTLLAGQADPSGVRSLLAAYVAMVVTDQLTAYMIVVVVALHEGRISREALVEAVTWGLAVAVSNTSVGLLVVVLLARQPAAVPMLAVIVTVLLVAYRAYGKLGLAHARLEQYHGFAQSISRAHGTDSVVARILEGARDLMQAETAELYLDGTEHRLDGTRPAHRQQRQWLTRVRDGAVVIGRGSEDRDDLLLLAGASQAAAAPVRYGGGIGVLVVTEPMGQVGTFSADQTRSLETLAHQAGIALENGALVDRLRQEAAEREHEALHDALTGLLNRRGFVGRTDAVLAKEPIAAVLLLNIDRFKDINDALGHSFGDEVLAELAERLRLVRPAAAVSRLGGDEFAMLLPGALPAEVAEVATKMVEAVEQPIRIRDVDLHVDASIGSALAPNDGQDAEELLRRADVAMYRAKERRSGHAEYDPKLDRSGAERLALYSDLRHAVRDGMLQVHLQPLIAPATGRVCGAEALARWIHPVRGYVPPDQFIALAERSGLIHPLTMLILGQSLGALADLRGRGLLDQVSVNISARMLLDPALPDQIVGALATAGLPASALTCEVTETSMMADPDRAMTILHTLDEIGVRLSVDDFGTGYSSLSYLARLPLDEVKIDRSFVLGMNDKRENQVIVRSTIELAHQLGLEVVAEGIEDAETLEQLRSWGCDVAQGYFFSRPVPPEALAEWLTAQRTRVS